MLRKKSPQKTLATDSRHNLEREHTKMSDRFLQLRALFFGGSGCFVHLWHIHDVGYEEGTGKPYVLAGQMDRYRFEVIPVVD